MNASVSALDDCQYEFVAATVPLASEKLTVLALKVATEVRFSAETALCCACIGNNA
jgi:hypothetical protein